VRPTVSAVVHMQTSRASIWPSLIIVALALVCFAAALFFEGQCRQARRTLRRAARTAQSPIGVVEASVPAVPDQNKYELRAWWMFYAAVGVSGFGFIMAVRHRCRANWIAAFVAGAVALSIPVLVIWGL
jgi:hypothetical protein